MRVPPLVETNQFELTCNVPSIVWSKWYKDTEIAMAVFNGRTLSGNQQWMDYET
jgi:hypothetical protein